MKGARGTVVVGVEVRHVMSWKPIYKGLISHLRMLGFILSKMEGIRRFLSRELTYAKRVLRATVSRTDLRGTSMEGERPSQKEIIQMRDIGGLDQGNDSGTRKKRSDLG